MKLYRLPGDTEEDDIFAIEENGRYIKSLHKDYPNITRMMKVDKFIANISDKIANFLIWSMNE